MLDDKKKKGTIWKLFFQPDPDRQLVSGQEMPWILGIIVFSFITLIILKLFEFFTS